MLNKAMTFLILGGLGIFFTSLAFAEGEQWLRYKYGTESFEGMTSYPIKLTANKPAGLELPEFKDSKPMFGEWKSPLSKGGKLQIALDSSDKPGTYDLLYIDSDGDGSLKNEKPVKIKGGYNSYQDESGPVKVLLEGPDGPVTYHLNFRRFKTYDSRIILQYSSGCWYEGTIEVAGEKKKCILMDATVNGKFNDTSKEYYAADRITIGEGEKERTAPVGRFLHLDDKLYRLEVAEDGAYIKLSPAADVVFGRVKAPPEINELSVMGENGLFQITQEKGKDSIPAGQYRIQKWQICKKDANDNNWIMTGEGFNDSGDFEASKNATAYLAVGEPVTSNLEVKAKRGKYTFSQNLTGQMGERVSLAKNNSRGPSPKLHIVSDDKTYDRRFSFEYG